MSGEIIDINVWLGAWPFAYFHENTAARLAAHLAREGVDAAFVGNPEAAFNNDYVETNRILTRSLARYPNLHPVYAVDPTVGDGKTELAKARDNGAYAVRIMPSFHDYDAKAPALIDFVDAVANAGDLLLFVQMRMEDERTHHRLCKIAPFREAQIVALAQRFFDLPIVVLCALYHEAVAIVSAAQNVYVGISHVETLRTLGRFIEAVPRERVLFGSHTPFLYTRGAHMKLTAPYVPAGAQRAIGSENIRALIAGRGRKLPRSRR